MTNQSTRSFIGFGPDLHENASESAEVAGDLTEVAGDLTEVAGDRTDLRERAGLNQITDKVNCPAFPLIKRATGW